jgi:hypothetical protein
MTIPTDEIDNDDIYGGVPVGEYERPKHLKNKFQKLKTHFLESAKEAVGQTVKGVTAGSLGAYGDIANLFGVNPPEEYITPGEQAKYTSESDILEKMQKPGYKPSYNDIYGLSHEEDIAPQFSRLPQTQELKNNIEDIGGPGSPLTTAGEFADRASTIYGQNLAFKFKNPKPAIAAGAAGQTAKELGGGPLVQATAEIAAILATQGKSNPLNSKDPVIQARVNALRNLGYTDKEITIAVNAHKAGSNQVKKAKATEASEQAFNETLGKSEALFGEILSDVFPGIEHGVEHIHQVARDAYGQVARSGRNVTITNPTRFQRTVNNVIGRLRNTLGENPEAAPFIERLEGAAAAMAENPNAERMINFYQELNRLGKWVDPKYRERLITHVKNGIKSTFRNSGPEGRQLAERFEEVNHGVQRAYQAEAVNNLLSQAATVEGIDWNKMLKLFDKRKNWDILEEGLGHTQTSNLREIAKVAKDTGDFQKSLGSLQKGGKLSGWVNTAKGAGFIYAIANGHYKTAALIAGSHISKEALSRLQTRLLTDPKFQNIIIRTFDAVKKGSPQSLQKAANSFQQIAEDEGIDLDSF